MINLSKNDQAEALTLLDHIFLQKSDDGLDDDLLAAKLRKRWRKKWTSSRPSPRRSHSFTAARAAPPGRCAA